MITPVNSHTVLEEESVKRLYQPAVQNIPGYYGLVFDAYGIGNYIEWFSSGEKSVSHGGQGTGWMTHFQSVPATGDGIVILSNSQRSWPVFAYLLSDWTAWSGFSPAGMERIITGQKLLWSFTAVLLFIILWQLWGIIKSLISGRLSFIPGVKVSKGLIILELIFSIILISGILYAVNMDYQPLYSIFPIASHWVFNSLLVVGVLMLFQALFPFKREN